jgi:hypothetical protein
MKALLYPVVLRVGGSREHCQSGQDAEADDSKSHFTSPLDGHSRMVPVCCFASPAFT